MSALKCRKSDTFSVDAVMSLRGGTETNGVLRRPWNKIPGA
jgi:hypothetical protein